MVYPAKNLNLAFYKDKLNMKGIQEILQELHANIPEESIGKSVDKIMKQVKNENNSKLIRLPTKS
jgi:hypothetical protein